MESGFVLKGSGISNVWYIHVGELSYQNENVSLVQFEYLAKGWTVDQETLV